MRKGLKSMKCMSIINIGWVKSDVVEKLESLS